MLGTNTLAYYDHLKIADAKNFVILVPGVGEEEVVVGQYPGGVVAAHDVQERSEKLKKMGARLVPQNFANLTFCQLDILST